MTAKQIQSALFVDLFHRRHKRIGSFALNFNNCVSIVITRGIEITTPVMKV